MRKAKKNRWNWGNRWGKKKSWKEPTTDKNDQLFMFRCDKVTREIEEKLRASVKVYTSETYSQEFLRTLVSPMDESK